MSTRFWRDRPVLVTGATGLVGGWLVQRLVKEGAAVVCLVRDWVPRSVLLDSELTGSVQLVRGDVRQSSVMERVLGEYEVDTVFHLAAQTIVTVANRNPVSTFESNIRGSWSVMEACRRSPAVKQVVLASSDKAYGDAGGEAYSEEMPLRGRHPYDVSKSCADLIAQTYAHTYGLPVAITRCGNFYGGGDLNWSRLVPGTIRAAIAGERPVIRSDGSYIRDYFYVEDGAAAYMLLAERLAGCPEMRGEAFNFSDESQMPVLELVRRILGLMECDVEPVILGETVNELRAQRLGTAKARAKLGWQPLFSLEEGLRETIRWYRQHFAHG